MHRAAPSQFLGQLLSFRCDLSVSLLSSCLSSSVVLFHPVAVQVDIKLWMLRGIRSSIVTISIAASLPAYEAMTDVSAMR